MRRPAGRHPTLLLLGIVLALLLLLEAAVSLVVLAGHERHLEPELRLKADTIGRAVRRQVEQALGYGIPLEGLVGLDEIIAPVMREAPELALVALTDPAGTLRHAHGLPAPLARQLVAGDATMEDHLLLTLPLTGPGGEAGHLHLAIDPGFLHQQLGAVLIEVAVVIVVSLLVTMELLLALLGAGERSRQPGPPRPAGLPRLATFLLVLGTSLALPFLPAFIARQGAGPAFEPMLAALPLALALALAAVGTALARLPALSARRRGTILAGAAAAMAGLLAAGHAGADAAQAAALGLAGLGGGLALASIRALVPGRGRAALLPGGGLAALACGPALGGMLAETVGPPATLAMGALLILLAGALAWRAGAGKAAGQPGRPLPPEPRRPSPWRSALGNWRLLALGLLAALPACLLLTGLLAFAVPRHLAETGAGWAEIGRMLMLWALPALALTPACAAIADRWGGQGVMVGLGGILAGAGLVPLLFIEAGIWLPAAMLLLGTGQAMSQAGLPRLALRVASGAAAACGPAPALAVLDGSAWLGAAAGPPALAGLLALHDAATALALAGLGAIAGAVLLSSLLLVTGYEPEPTLADLPLAAPVGPEAGEAAA